MNVARLQHLLPAAFILALAIIVTWLSFTQQPAESFLFPRVVSIAFIIFAGWNFARAALGLARTGAGLSKQEILNILPGLALMVVYVFWAAKALGFYSASTLAFFILYSLYDPVPFTSVKDWVKRALVSILFMVTIYGLFYLLLQVQTPRGLNF